MKAVLSYFQIAKSRPVQEWVDGKPTYFDGPILLLSGTLQFQTGTILSNVQVKLTEQEAAAVEAALQPVEDRICNEMAQLRIAETGNAHDPL